MLATHNKADARAFASFAENSSHNYSHNSSISSSSSLEENGTLNVILMVSGTNDCLGNHVYLWPPKRRVDL